MGGGSRLASTPYLAKKGCWMRLCLNWIDDCKPGGQLVEYQPPFALRQVALVILGPRGTLRI